MRVRGKGENQKANAMPWFAGNQSAYLTFSSTCVSLFANSLATSSTQQPLTPYYLLCWHCQYPTGGRGQVGR